MQLTLDIRGFSTAIVPDQDYADAVCIPSRCPFFYDNECWIYNICLLYTSPSPRDS